MNALTRIEEAFPGRTRRDYPLSSYCAYKVGGAAELFVEPESPEELGAFLTLARREGVPVFVLGGGTNLLIRDGGIRGTVLRLGKSFRWVAVTGTELRAGAIAPMSKVAIAAEEASLAGLTFGYDIPGTVGGALRMNAGAHGGEIKDVLKEVRGFDLDGTEHIVAASEIRFAYRTAVYPRELVFVEGAFSLTPADRRALAEERARNHAHRLATQPKGNSVGSVFVNPAGDHAGRLVEAAGLKGFRIGGAVVSEKHGNWILNDGKATAAEIEGLIVTVQTRVKERFGVELKTEVKIVGEAAPTAARQGAGGMR
jgi:UDP-N-acetylmuramate dehydrogenase